MCASDPGQNLGPFTYRCKVYQVSWFLENCFIFFRHCMFWWFLQSQRTKQTTVLAPVIDLKRGSSSDERQIVDTPPHVAAGLKVRAEQLKMQLLTNVWEGKCSSSGQKSDYFLRMSSSAESSLTNISTSDFHVVQHGITVVHVQLQNSVSRILDSFKLLGKTAIWASK